jgi:16S rRNA (cytosine967-C5)-methyltransferase
LAKLTLKKKSIKKSCTSTSKKSTDGKPSSSTYYDRARTTLQSKAKFPANQTASASTDAETTNNISYQSSDDNSQKGIKVRVVAAQILHKVLNQRQSLDSVFEASRAAIHSRDQGLLTHLVQGVLRWNLALEPLYSRHLESDISPKDQILNVILAMGIYQFHIMRQPDYVVINTLVEAAKQVGKPRAAGLINAVLRKCVADKADSEALLVPGLKTHPNWLVEAIADSCANGGSEKLVSVLQANDETPATWMRVSPNYQTMVMEEFADAGIKLQQSAEINSAFLLPPHVNIVNALELGGKHVTVQDISAQVLADVLTEVSADLPANAEVLDACAAPGGKTSLMAERWPDWQITAVDQSVARLERMRENLMRQDMVVKIAQADLANADEDFYAEQMQYDCIVLDAPCSAIGVIRRHPDIKHLRVPKTVMNAQKAQQTILKNLWPKLKPNGYLVYITCSYLRAETTDVLTDFLQQQTADVLPLKAPYFSVNGEQTLGSIIYPDQQAGLMPQAETTDIDGLDFKPEQPRMDGFFYSLLKKPV